MSFSRSCLVLLCVCGGLTRLLAAEPPPFEQCLDEANRLLEQGKHREALAAAKAAANLDTNRFEAPFLAAVIFAELKQPTPAQLALDAALALAPAEKKARLEALRQQLANAANPEHRSLATTNATAGSGGQLGRSPSTKSEAPVLSGAARRQYDTLVLIIEEADKTTLADERKKLLQEFMETSGAFLKENRDQLPIWTLRAVAALELNQAKAGWAAGKELKRLGAENSEDPKLRKVMASLEREGWLADTLPRQDYSALTLDRLNSAAAGGDSKAQIALGDRLDSDKSTEAQAIFWYRKAADAGDSWAMDRLGYALQRKRIGAGSPDPEAIRWLVRAVELGSVGTALNLASQMRFDADFPKDDQEVVRLLEVAASHVSKGTGHVHDSPLGQAPWAKTAVALALADALATSPDAKARNGQRALKLALEGQSANTQYKYKDLEILAAAYAEAGDFDFAVKTAQEALSSLVAEDRYNADDITKQLKQYKKRKPWRGAL